MAGSLPRNVYGECAESLPRDGSIQKESAGFVAPGQTAHTWVGKVAAAVGTPTSLILYTVPTGKLFILTDVFISHDTAAALDTQIQRNTGMALRIACKGDTAPFSAPGFETQTFFNEGETLTLVLPSVAGATNFYFTLCGISQTVGAG
jgi:hypothetical protein